jgi:predicted negative regulator of RcsB-dependent stress response
MAKIDRYTAPRQTVVTQEAPQVNSIEDTYIPSAEESLDKVRAAVGGNTKTFTYILGGLALLVIGFLGYKYWTNSKNEKAANEIGMASTFMLMDSTNLMVNGLPGEKIMGAAKIADNYSGTANGNTAAYMAGMGYLQMGDFKNAIKYLEKFDGDNTILGTIATGSLGDAYWENKQMDKAVDCYEKAGADEDNFQYAPVYLQRAGVVYEAMGKPEKAIACYTKIKEKFAQSSIARDIDKYLAKLGVVTE